MSTSILNIFYVGRIHFNLNIIYVGKVHHTGLPLDPHVSYNRCTIPSNIICVPSERTSIVLVLIKSWPSGVSSNVMHTRTTVVVWFDRGTRLDLDNLRPHAKSKVVWSIFLLKIANYNLKLEITYIIIVGDFLGKILMISRVCSCSTLGISLQAGGAID